MWSRLQWQRNPREYRYTAVLIDELDATDAAVGRWHVVAVPLNFLMIKVTTRIFGVIQEHAPGFLNHVDGLHLTYKK